MTTLTKDKTKLNFGLILAIYLLGIFMGALDTGIVTPARTVIQESLDVSDNAGIWMITIYTLAYASSIPVMGKLADRMGRRTIYLVSIFLFGAGSLMCGLSHSFDSFTMLLISRAIQAIGGGGIMPVATAEFGTTFPEEKRGMALGMVGGVYGIANIFGASVGSAVMDFFGTDRWEFIFYVNVPIAAAILIAGFRALPNTKEKAVSRIDSIGIGLLVVMVLSLMYGIKNIDFFNFSETIAGTDVYPFLIAFAVLLPLFIAVEKRAEDPVMNLSYFTRLRILVTMSIAIITGIVLMGVVFIPQLCENAMMMPTGKGGYFVIALGVFAGVGAMASGKLTDRFGPRFVLGIGFAATIAGSLIIILSTTQNPGIVNVFASLTFVGLGIGFTTGAPLNYMMLWEVDERESNSALATLSLVRSIGTVIAPAIMVGFIAHAGAGITDDVMKIMPEDINVPQLPYAEELSDEMQKQDIEGMPDLESMTSMKIDLSKASSGSKSGKFQIPSRIMDKLKSSDVTTITANVKEMADFMFGETTPDIEEEIYSGVDKGIDGIETGIDEMDSSIAKMTEARNGMQKGINGMNRAISKQTAALNKLKSGRKELSSGIAGIEAGMAELQKQIDEQPVPAVKDQMQQQLDEMQAKRDSMAASKSKMDRGISSLQGAISKIRIKRNELAGQQAEMDIAIAGIREGRREASDTIDKMETMKAAVPDAFAEAEDDYLKQIDDESDLIEHTFQSALNTGFRQIYLMVGIASLVGVLFLVLYRRKPERKQ